MSPRYEEKPTQPVPQLRQIVFSSRPIEVPGAVEVLTGDAAAHVRRLKARDGGGDLWLCGSAHLACQLVDEIDRFVLKVSPVVLGTGLPRFTGVRAEPRRFLPHVQVEYANDVRVVDYRRA
jgi:dihydrofolate reductase